MDGPIAPAFGKRPRTQQVGKEAFMRSFACVVLALGLAAVPLSAGANAAQPQDTGADKPVLTLNGDAAVITVLIKPDKTADFEMVVAKLRQSLQESPKPERKAQAAGWTVFKCTQMAQGNVVYVMRIDPIVKGAEYDITRIIAGGPGDLPEIQGGLRRAGHHRDDQARLLAQLTLWASPHRRGGASR
jgi:hypothetical protein